jgi:endonuclease/exonuclease/phosphatase family metal-dependent hydrolase
MNELPPGRPLRFRAASYNIHRTVGPDRRRRPERVARVIQELDAGIVGLQEVDWHAGSAEDGESQAEFLAHLPGYEAIAGSNILDHRGHYGNMLLTRFPVSSIARIDISVERREPRGAVDVVLDCEGVALRVLVTHFGLGLRERRRQSAQLAAIVADEPRLPTLLLGDVNDWMIGSPTIAPLLREADDADAPRSFPSLLPLFALDRIVTWRMGGTARLRLHAHRTKASRWASDHLPVVAEIALQRSQ